MRVNTKLRFSLAIVAILLSVGLLSQHASAAISGTSLTTSPVTLGLNIKPGQTQSETVKIMNNGTSPLPIVMQVKTFGAYGSSGEAAIQDFSSNNPASSYVKFSPNNFTAQPGVWSYVQVTITLPKNATLGFYYAIVFKPVVAKPIVGQNGSIITGDNAILLLINTNSGNEVKQLQVAKFTVSKSLYEYLPASFSVLIHNGGNIYIAPTGDIFISKHADGSHTIASLSVNQNGGNILPNSNRQFTASWGDGFPVYVPVTKNGQTVYDKNNNPKLKLQWNFSNVSKFRFGKYYAQLAMAYNNGSRAVLLNSKLSFWVIPWKLMLVALVIILIILAGLFVLFRSIYRKIRSKQKSKSYSKQKPPTINNQQNY